MADTQGKKISDDAFEPTTGNASGGRKASAYRSSAKDITLTVMQAVKRRPPAAPDKKPSVPQSATKPAATPAAAAGKKKTVTEKPASDTQVTTSVVTYTRPSAEKTSGAIPVPNAPKKKAAPVAAPAVEPAKKAVTPPPALPKAAPLPSGTSPQVADKASALPNVAAMEETPAGGEVAADNSPKVEKPDSGPISNDTMSEAAAENKTRLTADGILLNINSVYNTQAFEALPDNLEANAAFEKESPEADTAAAELRADENGGDKDASPPHKKRGLRRFGRIAAQAFGILFVFLLSAVVLVYGAVTMLSTGPFPTARDLFVVSVEETSAIKFLSRIHHSEEEVQAILDANTVLPITEVTDTTREFEPLPETDGSEADIEIYEVTGNTFVGKMMVIQDPSRVELACLDTFSEEIRGKTVEKFAEEAGATAAINSGMFADPGGVGLGGLPQGLLIKDGVIRNGSLASRNIIVGFDDEHHLIVGEMSGAEALGMNVRDAVTVDSRIMPPLIINNNPTEFTGNGSGLNPRTALGQRADGAVLMLVIDGRQPHSLGATLQDCQKLMMEYGAINASMLDGGSSSVMYYEGETINVCASLYGSRSQPSAWLVM